jgi:hypothetical protein
MRLRRVCWSAFSSGMRTKSGPFADRADPRSARPRSHAVDVLGPGRSREAYAGLGIRFIMPTTGLRRLSPAALVLLVPWLFSLEGERA